MNLLTLIPLPARIAIVVAAGIALYMLGMLHGERSAGQAHIDYISKQAAQSVKVAQAHAKIVIETQIKYVDRIKTIYKQGETIEKQVPIYITADDNAGCTINTGFVRIHDAAWTGEPPGSATSADREPAGIPLAEVAETNAFNATACLAWREQALGLREFYQKLKKVRDVE
ncbi:hypothetical protein KDM87_06770 [Undibacterium sp. FT147W]|uniref:Uncharacterized protein n=1 Tax=Undibacterium rivi TaxID=2828729 RepID=A0ABS5H0S2_9BURK|nr:hypothetical protein [Undibacterium rivi]MBR7792298.1 hypothetical protein [Undibacterium rivi]